MEQIPLFENQEPQPEKVGPLYDKNVTPDTSLFFDSENIIFLVWSDDRGQWEARYKPDDPGDMYKR